MTIDSFDLRLRTSIYVLLFPSVGCDHLRGKFKVKVDRRIPEFKDGVLMVRLPKTEEVKPKRQAIPIVTK